MTKTYPTNSAGFKSAEEKAVKALAEIYGIEESRIIRENRVRRVRTDPNDPLGEEELHNVRIEFRVTIPGPGEEKEIEAEKQRARKEAEAAKAREAEQERQRAEAAKKAAAAKPSQ